MGRKGQVPWNKGLTKETDSRIKASSGSMKKGNIPWNKGKKMSEEYNKKKSLEQKKRFATYEHPRQGKHHTQESKDKISTAKLGYGKGEKRPKEWKDKMSKSMIEFYKNNPAARKAASERTKKQMSDPIARKRISNFQKGKIIPKEQRERQSKNLKKFWRDNPDKLKEAEEKSKLILKNKPGYREFRQKIWRDTRKNIGRPNIPEKAIGEILSGVGIKCKFLHDVSYRTLDNKPSSKEMDLVWKDSRGNKKIIEYNGRYHFDPRKHKSNEIHVVHNKPTKCKDIWDEENMILNQIRKEGYKILVVWELDWMKKLDITTKNILKFAKS